MFFRGLGSDGSCQVILGMSLGSRLLWAPVAGIGSSECEGSTKATGDAAVAAGESVAQQLVRVDPEKTGLNTEKD